MSRDTKTGRVLEQMVIPSLDKGGYKTKEQVNVGKRPGGGNHQIDVIASGKKDNFLISLKWQQVSGTAEQKVPFEVICLTEAILKSKKKYKKAYLVLGGSGWRLRDFYTSGELKKYLEYDKIVDILTLEDFIAIANKHDL